MTNESQPIQIESAEAQSIDCPEVDLEEKLTNNYFMSILRLR